MRQNFLRADIYFWQPAGNLQSVHGVIRIDERHAGNIQRKTPELGHFNHKKAADRRSAASWNCKKLYERDFGRVQYFC